MSKFNLIVHQRHFRAAHRIYTFLSNSTKDHALSSPYAYLDMSRNTTDEENLHKLNENTVNFHISNEDHSTVRELF